MHGGVVSDLKIQTRDFDHEPIGFSIGGTSGLRIKLVEEITYFINPFK